MKKIKVQEVEISILSVDDEDYISLTDMVKGIENGLALIEKWLRNKNTIEFLGIWEEMYNPDFNSPEFGGILSEAGTNRFLLSVKQWVERTNSRGIMAKTGRTGGTYAHDQVGSVAAHRPNTMVVPRGAIKFWYNTGKEDERRTKWQHPA